MEVGQQPASQQQYCIDEIVAVNYPLQRAYAGVGRTARFTTDVSTWATRTPMHSVRSVSPRCFSRIASMQVAAGVRESLLMSCMRLLLPIDMTRGDERIS
jgi:hypothetical protein